MKRKKKIKNWKPKMEFGGSFGWYSGVAKSRNKNKKIPMRQGGKMRYQLGGGAANANITSAPEVAERVVFILSETLFKLTDLLAIAASFPSPYIFINVTAEIFLIIFLNSSGTSWQFS